MKWRAVSAVVCGLVFAAPQGWAADYPSRPIKLIVPYAAGGPSDVQARMVADYLGRDLKQTIVIENRAGAQGAIGAEMAARSEPDGYTLLFSAASVFVLNPLLYKKLSYDPAKDFRMLAVVTDQPAILEINPSVPARTVAELVAYAKQNPGKLNFGSAGTGGSAHLAGEMFRQMAGIDMVHVPYKGMPRRCRICCPAISRCCSIRLVQRCRRSMPDCCGRSRSVPRSASTNCPTCRPSPRAVIPIT